MAHAETLASDMGTLASKAAWKVLQIVRMKHTKKNNNILMILLVNKSWIHIHIWDIYIYTYLQYIYIYIFFIYIRTYIVSLHMYVRRNQRSSPLALVAIARTWKMFVAPCISTDHDIIPGTQGTFYGFLRKSFIGARWKLPSWMVYSAIISSSPRQKRPWLSMKTIYKTARMTWATSMETSW